MSWLHARSLSKILTKSFIGPTKTNYKDIAWHKYQEKLKCRPVVEFGRISVDLGTLLVRSNGVLNDDIVNDFNDCSLPGAGRNDIPAATTRQVNTNCQN